MKKDYNKNKNMVIAGLVAVAIFLVAGLCWYLGNMRTAEVPAEPFAGSVSEQTEVEAPEIKLPKTEAPGALKPTAAPEKITKPAADEDTSQKPQTKEEAVEPENKPEVADTGALTNPEQVPQYEAEPAQPSQSPETAPTQPPEAPPAQPPEEPAGGTVNSEGKIFVPGFGYVDDPGAPIGESAGSDGDWNKQIGEMN